MAKTTHKTSGKLRVASRTSGHIRTFVFCIIAICAGTVFLGVYISFNYSADKVAERELNYLAKDYYETYYHKTVANLSEEKKKDAEENGLPAVPLRLLYLFDNGRHEKSRQYFETPSIKCDSNNTYVYYTPHAPYGQKDYKYGYALSCDKFQKRVNLD